MEPLLKRHGESGRSSLHLWNRDVLKLIGDGCGGFIAVDNKTDSLAELQWARMLVKMVGRDTPSSVQIVDEKGCFSVQLWWESSPWFSQVVPRRRVGEGWTAKGARGVVEPPCGSSSRGATGFPFESVERGPGAEVTDGEDSLGIKSQGAGKLASLGGFKSGPAACDYGPFGSPSSGTGLERLVSSQPLRVPDG
ncbi:hypothetical protein CK203_049792 [Vitis vinifera]|uniref:Uncharacterized protein n=1 Tax=Vitis vinifera TaxID=29760 RepID=A0A438H213_VITVI|nr:hypothetical protein CK203_049792 [Vitis vinifera]